MKDRVRKESPEHLQVKLGCLAEDQEQEGMEGQEEMGGMVVQGWVAMEGQG